MSRPMHALQAAHRLLLLLRQPLLLVPLLLLATLPGSATTVPDEPAIDVHATLRSADLWPAVRVRQDPQGQLTLEDVRRTDEGFEAPAGAASTLGVAKGPVWLRAALRTAVDAGGEWVIDIDYPPLHVVEIALLRDGALVHRVQMGAKQPRQPGQGRTHATMVPLEGSATYELLVRVQTEGAVIVPMRISRPGAFHERALNEQMLQGVLIGLGACLILYSLIQWLVVREAMFAKYALMTGGSLLFSIFLHGTGGQFLWPGSVWMELHAGGLAALMATTGSFLFIGEVLDTTRGRWWLRRVLNAGAALTAVLALLFVSGVIGARAVTALVSVLGLVPVLLGIPVAMRRAWRGDRIGANLLLAWVVYFIATAVMIGVINGGLPANAWTMHAFQFGATIDMLLFMRILGLRVAAVHQEARRAHRERDALRSLALSDPLTGLLNRRGMDELVARLLPDVGPQKALAIFLMDLDGFKAVNDQHGHGAGDQLLVYAGQRLRHCVREGDHVVRLGGDEFVVIATGLTDERQAEDIGQQLLHRFERPFKLDELHCDVGATVGYAVAPQDGTDLETLLARADAAMYAGKQAGKRCVRRAPPRIPLPSDASALPTPTAANGPA